MKHMLRKIVELASFDILQRKLERWLDEYNYNTCDQNVEKCIEIIELNSGVQAQLFELLQMSACEGGKYGGSDALKTRLLPWLSQAGVVSPIARDETALKAMKELMSEEVRRLKATGDDYDRTLADLEADLNESRTEVEQLKAELDEKTDELYALKRRSSTERIFTETELQRLRNKVHFLEDELTVLRSRWNISNSRESEAGRMHDGLMRSSPDRKSGFVEGFDAAGAQLNPSSPTNRSGLLSVGEHAERRRQDRALAAFNDLSVIGRREAEKTLRRYSDDEHNVRRIIFAALQESFSMTRVAFLNYKMRVRSTLAPLLTGPDSLETSVYDYISRNSEAYDLTQIASNVARVLGRKVGISLPPEVSYEAILPFIREACRISWAMNSLLSPIEMAAAANFELHDGAKYRRTYDSDFDAGLITYHTWPCLMQGHRVLIKGEAYTTNASTAESLLGGRSSSSCLRSSSPSRLNAVASTGRSRRATTRTPSPRRIGIGSVSNGNESRTASSSLSHYGVFG